MQTGGDKCTAVLLAAIKRAYAGTICLDSIHTLADLTPEAIRRQHATAIAYVREQRFMVLADLAAARNRPEPDTSVTVQECRRRIGF